MGNPKRIVILGSTGSIGTQTLDVVRENPHSLRVVGLAASSNGHLLREQAAQFSVARTALFNLDAASHHGTAGGMAALVDLATGDDVDLVVVAVAGVVGLLPTIAAIEAGKQIALASKEVLVAAGELVMPLIKKYKTLLTPIDSEHSAIFQCLQGYQHSQVDSLILTASGGPFRGKRKEDLVGVTAEEALKHPTWSMGGKITVDSATLFNKALETIEAHWLFDVAMDSVEVVIHPGSICHSFVRFRDGSVLGQFGWPNMRLPIQYALLYPERKPNLLPRWDPIQTSPLVFEPVDHETFPAIRQAQEAMRLGQTAPCAFNAANEEAVRLFLEHKIKFLDIPHFVADTMAAHQPSSVTLEALIHADANARETVRVLSA